MGHFESKSTKVEYGSRKTADNRWAIIVVKTTKEGVIDLSPPETCLWRSTAWRKAKALARKNINIYIPESTPESRERSATNIAKWAYARQDEFLEIWRAEFYDKKAA